MRSWLELALVQQPKTAVNLLSLTIRRSQVRVRPSAPNKYLQNAGTYEGPTLVSDLCTPFAIRARILVQGTLQNRFGPGVFHPSSMGMPAPPSSACPASTSLTLPLSSSLQPSNIRAEVVDVGWGFMPVSRE